MATAESILDQIGQARQALTANKPGSREKMIELAYKLALTLETPSESLFRIGVAEPARFAGMRMAVDLKLFGELKRRGGDGVGVGVSEIAEAVSADPALIGRLTKHLAAVNIISEKAADTYQATELSNAFTERRFRDGIVYLFDVCAPSFHEIPKYLQKTSYRNPNNIMDGPFQFAHKTDSPFFKWIGENGYLEAFNNYMAGYRQGAPSWHQFYPFQERVVEGFEKEGDRNGVLMVDVGGGLGHDLADLKKSMPGLPGKLVLQDRPEVIAQVDRAKMDGVEAMPHDFFTTQVVHGAKAYYLHSVLHDWDNASSIRILRSLLPALKPSYSRILINELVVPNTHASAGTTAMDWLMMALGAVRERTEKEWRGLVEGAGLRVLGVWNVEGGRGGESVVECELVGR